MDPPLSDIPLEDLSSAAPCAAAGTSTISGRPSSPGSSHLSDSHPQDYNNSNENDTSTLTTNNYNDNNDGNTNGPNLSDQTDDNGDARVSPPAYTPRTGPGRQEDPVLQLGPPSYSAALSIPARDSDLRVGAKGLVTRKLPQRRKVFVGAGMV